MTSTNTLSRRTYSGRSSLVLGLTLVACGGGGDGGTPPTPPRQPVAVAVAGGNGQQGVVGEELPTALVARVVDAEGRGVAGQSVSFVVTEGGGHVYAGAALTNASGTAQERWTLGTVAGAAQKLEARAVDPQTGDKLLFATFTATAAAGPISSLAKAGGDAQTAAAGSQLPTTLVVRGTDRYGNVVTAGSVTWSVTSGGGAVSAAQTPLDAQGRAQTAWTLGTTVGSQTVTATVGALSVTFTANATTPPPPLRWAPMSSPTTATLLDVWGSSATDVWAVGEGGTIIHYDGASWKSVPSGTTVSLVRVWGTSRTNVYAISADNGTLLRYDGATWSAVAAPPRTSAPATQQVKYWINSPTDALALLRSASGGDSVMHWDGGVWSTVLRGVANASDVWMAPDGRALVTQAPGVGWRFDGTSWQSGVIGGNGGGISGKSYENVSLLYSGTARCCSYKHFNGTAIDYQSPEVLGFNSLGHYWFVSPSEIYAFWGAVFDGSRDNLLLVRVTASSFAFSPQHDSQGIFGRAIWGASPTAIFVVGEEGKLYTRNGLP